MNCQTECFDSFETSGQTYEFKSHTRKMNDEILYANLTLIIRDVVNLLTPIQFESLLSIGSIQWKIKSNKFHTVHNMCRY